MNQIETTICDAVKTAQKQYVDISGWWLHHAPESFLQIVICQELGKLGHYVYPDIQIKKIYKENDYEKHGLREDQLRQRPDVSVWYKTKRDGNPLISIIEVKRAYIGSPVIKDIHRVKDLCSDFGPKSGYVVVYSDSKNKAKLKHRFESWAKSSNSLLLYRYVNEKPDNDDHWGFCLIKVK